MVQDLKGASKKEVWTQALGQNIHRLRKVKNMTLKSTAAALHISPRTLSRLERGIIGKGMRVDVVLDAARLFRVRIASLFGPVDENGAGDS